MEKTYINVEYSNNGGITWIPDRVSDTTQVARTLAEGSPVVHQIISWYRLPQRTKP